MRLAAPGFMVMGLVSGLALASHSDSESFLVVHARSAQVDASDEGSGRWSGSSRLLVTFAKLAQFWWLDSSVFLTRTSHHKTTHANSPCGAQPGWAFQSACFPNTAVEIQGSQPQTNKWFL